MFRKLLTKLVGKIVKSPIAREIITDKIEGTIKDEVEKRKKRRRDQ